MEDAICVDHCGHHLRLPALPRLLTAPRPLLPMPPKIALGSGSNGYCQVISLDAYGAFPCVDFQDSSGRWNPGVVLDSSGRRYATLAAGTGNEGNLQVILLGEADHQPYLCWQAAGNGLWSSISSLPGSSHPAGYSAVAMAPGNSGNLQAILLGKDDGQPYLYWQAAGNGIWSYPTPLTSSSHPAGFSALAMGQGNDGNLQVVMLGRDDHQPYLFWQAAGNGIWAGPAPLTSSTHPAGFSALALAPGNSGNLQAILLGKDDGQPYLYWQAAGNGTWAGPFALTSASYAGGFSAIAANSGNDGNLQVVLLASDTNQPYLCWQAAGNGIWSGPTRLLPTEQLPTGIVEIQAFPSFAQSPALLQLVLRPATGNTLLLAWQEPQGNWTYYGELFYPTWMQDIAPSIASRKLTHLIIPGTHDSGTYGINTDSAYAPDSPISTGLADGGAEGAAIASNLVLDAVPVVGFFASIFLDAKASPASIKQTFVNWAIAQGWDFRQQLRAGIRHFDVRICKAPNGQFWIVHSLYSVPVAALLDAVSEFLSLHKQELLTLDINHTISMTSADDQVLIGQLTSALGPWLASSATFQPDSTVGSFLATSARIVLTYYFNKRPAIGGPAIWQEHQDAPTVPPGTPPLPIPGPMNSQQWPATTDLGELNTKLSSYIAGRTPNQLFVLQGIFTPGTTQIEGGIVGGTHTLAALCAPATQAVISWLPGWADKLNIVIVDHIENAPGYVRTVVRLNVEQGAATPQG